MMLRIGFLAIWNRGDLQARQLDRALIAARFIGRLEVWIAQKMTNTKNFRNVITGNLPGSPKQVLRQTGVLE
jgi:hypothetical protein